AEGLVVPLARVGAQLPGGMKIGPVKMRGVESAGMLCSARELGLSQDHAGLLELDADAPVGEDLRAYLDLDDTVFTLKLTPNRADCLSIRGVAREVAALTGAPMKPLAFEPVAPTIEDRLAVKVDATRVCGRSAGRGIWGVKARGETPARVARQIGRVGEGSISSLGVRSINDMSVLGWLVCGFCNRRIECGPSVRWARDG